VKRLSVEVDVRRTLITGVVLLALALAGSFVTNAVLDGMLESELTAHVPRALVTLSSFALFTLQMLGVVLVATAIVVRLSRPAHVDTTSPEAGDARPR
jgi:hypothetical protein